MNKLREKALIEIIDDLLWNAARFANGRSFSHSPSIVREAVQRMKTMYPLWSVKEDRTMHPPKPEDLAMGESELDYLWDIFNPQNK